jgi:hypothetical protein
MKASKIAMTKEIKESLPPDLVKVESEGDILSRVRKNPKFVEQEGIKNGIKICLIWF